MLTRGVPLKVVSEILGHSSIAITGDVYGHGAPDVAREALDVPSERPRQVRVTSWWSRRRSNRSGEHSGVVSGLPDTTADLRFRLSG